MLRQDTTLRLAWLLALALMFGTMAGCVGSGGDSTADTMDTNGDQSESDGEDDTSEDTEEDTTTDQTDPDMEDDVEVTEDADAEDADVEDDVPDTLMCEEGTDNCDGDDANGCETDLTALTTCGSCDNDCTGSFENASATCDTGECALGECSENFGNCDEDPNNGCEEDWGFAGGACCTFSFQLDITGIAGLRPFDDGYWVVFKNGTAVSSRLYCAEDWATGEAQNALSGDVELVWTRNCPDGFNDPLADWFNEGTARGGSLIIRDEQGLEAARYTLLNMRPTEYINVPAGNMCTETEQITFTANVQ